MEVLNFSPRALALILEFEGSSTGVSWPGGASGATIGIGYDLGYHTAGEIQRDWGPHLQHDIVGQLTTGAGVIGATARDVVRRLHGLLIPKEATEKVFYNTSLPRYTAMTLRAFPGVDKLPLDAQGALASLVYNRGALMVDRDPSLQERKEMREIREAVARVDLPQISASLRSMKRLWEGKGLDGLIRRREAEAQLVESCIPGGLS